MLAGIIVAFGVGWVLFRWLKSDDQLGRSAALYIGIPLVLAVILALSAPSRRPVGMALKVTTILLLLSIPVLGEGAVCVILSAPIFYLVVYVVAKSVENWRRERPTQTGNGPRASVFAVPVLLAILALEGTTPALTVPGDAAVSATRTIDVPSSRFAAALSNPMRFGEVTPGGILAMGFPKPHSDSGGLDVGDVRVITFDGAGHRHAMAQHHWGEAASRLSLTVTARTDTSVTFTPAALGSNPDTSPLSTWLRWDRIVVDWRGVGAHQTAVTWRLEYTRKLSPAWYFGPIELLVAWRAADYLVRAIDTTEVTSPTPAHQHGTQ